MQIDSYGPEGSAYQQPPQSPPPAGSPPSSGRPGLAWERRDELGIGTAMLRTIREVLFSPTAAFARMKQEGGWAEPLQFALVVGSIFFWVAQAWDLLVRSLFAGMPGFEMQDIAAANMQELWVALLAPLLVVVGTFFGAALVHVLLLMLGGAPFGYETTFRVICYSWAVAVLNVLPICGVFIGLAWRVVVQIIGVREAQQVPTGRAAAAVLIPVILACLCLFMAVLFTLSVAGLTQMGVS